MRKKLQLLGITLALSIPALAQAGTLTFNNETDMSSNIRKACFSDQKSAFDRASGNPQVRPLLERVLQSKNIQVTFEENASFDQGVHVRFVDASKIEIIINRGKASDNDLNYQGKCNWDYLVSPHRIASTIEEKLGDDRHHESREGREGSDESVAAAPGPQIRARISDREEKDQPVVVTFSPNEEAAAEAAAAGRPN
jgi:hypothetical protein